jgi:hypothetical protein
MQTEKNKNRLEGKLVVNYGVDDPREIDLSNRYLPLTISWAQEDNFYDGHMLGFSFDGLVDNLPSREYCESDPIRNYIPSNKGFGSSSPILSRQHCIIFQKKVEDNMVWVLADQRSRTGTYVNGNRLSDVRKTGEHILKIGDEIGLVPSRDGQYGVLIKYVK